MEEEKAHFFDGGQPYYWLQVTEKVKGQNTAMEVDSEGKNKATEHFKNISPIKLFKEIEKQFNPISKSTFRLRDGSFNFKVFKDEVELCKQVCVLNETPVQVLNHPFKNRCRGKVFSFETINLTEEDILEELKKYDVVKVVKKTAYNKSTKTKSHTGELTLTFDCDPSSKPEEVFCAYIHMKVESYVPRPLLCRKCFKYANHLTNECDQAIAICGWCGKGKHLNEEEEQCEEAKQCFNCKEDHPAWSRDCPAYKREQEILNIKEKEGIPYKRAQSIVDNGKAKSVSVAQVVAQNTTAVKENKNQLEQLIQKSDEMWRKRLDEQEMKWQQFYTNQQNAFQQALYDQREMFNQQMASMQAQMNEQLSNIMRLIPNLAIPNQQTPIAPVTPYTSITSPAMTNQQTLIPPYSTMQSPMSIPTQQYINQQLAASDPGNTNIHHLLKHQVAPPPHNDPRKQSDQKTEHKPPTKKIKGNSLVEDSTKEILDSFSS